jgi:CubicO group peptidase (beta-lactamase class C family)
MDDRWEFFNMKLGAAFRNSVILLALLSCQTVESDTTRRGRVLQPGKAEEVGMSSAALGAAVDIMRRAIAADKTTGVQLLVARHGRIVMHEALGLRDLERQRPMEDDTLLRMASVTKTVVATGILMLADEGRLNLSDPVSKVLPGFSTGLSSQLTVEHLLSHSTGFPYTSKNYVGEVTKKSPEHPDAPSLGVEASKIGEVGPEVAPGTTCRYSNSGLFVRGGDL